MAFDTVWQSALATLRKGNVIPRWARHSGYLPSPITMEEVTPQGLIVSTPSAKSLIFIPKLDFARVWAVWHGYLSGEVKRHQIQDLTRYSAYIISIIRCLQVLSLTPPNNLGA